MFNLPFIFRKTKQRRRFWLYLGICYGAVLLVNLFVGLLVHGNPFVPFTDAENRLAMIGTGARLGLAIFILNLTLSVIEIFLNKHHRKQSTAVLLWSAILLTSFTGCELKTGSRVQVKSAVHGTLSHVATGIKAVYKNLETESIRLVMNDEVLGHADIPLREKFYIVNEGIKGLQTKDGKVSVGCSLQLTDESGKVILDEPDLFQGNDIFNKEDVRYLRCAVSTGLPMETEYSYTVKARFWDKYGTGFIENTLRIRVIAIP